MKLKPTDLNDLKVDTVKRAVDTIGNRIDQLGLTEKSVQQYGEAGDKYEILVQLPGVDDPARVKELIGTTALLEICDVKDGPFPSREAALSQKGGILPLNTKLVRSKPRGGQRWRAVVPGGQDSGDHRAVTCATRVPGQDEFRKWETNFSSVAGWRPALRALHGSQHRQPAGGGAGQPDRQRGDDPVAKSRISGRITGLGSEEEGGRSVALPAAGSLPAGIEYSARSARSGRRWAPIRFTRASWRASPDWRR